MIDRQTARLLDILVRTCGEGGEFKILEIADLVSAFPKKKPVTREFVTVTAKFLADMQMIDIRHSDEEHMAIAILPRGRIYKEERRLQTDAHKFNRGMLTLVVAGSFMAAFIASLLAGLVVHWIS